MLERRKSMGKEMTLAEAVRKNEVFGYEFLIENGEITGASFEVKGEEIFVPAEWGCF